VKKHIGLCCLLFLCINGLLSAQVSNTSTYSKKGTMYFYYGYNRSLFSKSNIHFSGPLYDFTLYDVEASDRPTKLSATYINPVTFTVPQYNYRLGYFITKNLALSAGMDHLKYVVNRGQMAVISGVITKEASAAYAGSYLNQPIEIKPEFLQFEHTNGLNYASLDLEYMPSLLSLMKGKITMLCNVGLGGVWMITKTDVRVMEDGLDNRFHLSGYALSAKVGPRLEYNHRFFLAAEVKGGYATLPDVLIKNSAPERADHNFGFLEYYVVAGINFRIRK